MAWPLLAAGLELGHEPLEIRSRVHVVPARQACPGKTQPAGPPQGLLEHRRRAPGHVLEQIPVNTAQTDKVVAAVLAWPQDEVVLSRSDERHRALEEAGRKRGRVAVG